MNRMEPQQIVFNRFRVVFLRRQRTWTLNFSLCSFAQKGGHPLLVLEANYRGYTFFTRPLSSRTCLTTRVT